MSSGKVASTIPRSSITVLTGKRIGIKAAYSGKVYSVGRLEARSKVTGEIKARKKRIYKRMAGSHPWKSSYAASIG